MLDWNGDAGIWLSQSDSVRQLYERSGTLVDFVFHRATQTDDVGELYLSNVDFLKNGVPASIIAAIVCTTQYYSPVMLS
jgi:hypothetical protein